MMALGLRKRGRRGRDIRIVGVNATSMFVARGKMVTE
jgi:hypothetical protein